MRAYNYLLFAGKSRTEHALSEGLMPNFATTVWLAQKPRFFASTLHVDATTDRRLWGCPHARHSGAVARYSAVGSWK